VISEKLAQVLVEYDAWADARAETSAKEASGNFPPPDEWHWSDDTAVDLLHQIVNIIREDT
jgi:hypothetical protein